MRHRQYRTMRLGWLTTHILVLPRLPFGQDPTASVKYYEERFGLKLVDVYHTPTLGKSTYYLASVREGETWPEPGTAQVSKHNLKLPAAQASILSKKNSSTGHLIISN